MAKRLRGQPRFPNDAALSNEARKKELNLMAPIPLTLRPYDKTIIHRVKRIR